MTSHDTFFCVNGPFSVLATYSHRFVRKKSSCILGRNTLEWSWVYWQ